MRNLDTFVFLGSEIRESIGKAIAEANRCDDQCKFDFNGVTVVVAKDSSADLIYRDWSRGMNGYLGKDATVGPYPSPELSPECLASDSKIEAENEDRRQKQQAEYAARKAEKVNKLRALLEKAPAMAVSDPAKWEQYKANNSDGYGGRIVRFAEEWARLMQSAMADGQSLVECAEPLSNIADDDGITGFMYGAAVSLLSDVWEHGEQLRQWHNRDTQIGTEGEKANKEGGVLNPALLNIS